MRKGRYAGSRWSQWWQRARTVKGVTLQPGPSRRGGRGSWSIYKAGLVCQGVCGGVGGIYLHPQTGYPTPCRRRWDEGMLRRLVTSTYDSSLAASPAYPAVMQGYLETVVSQKRTKNSTVEKDVLTAKAERALGRTLVKEGGTGTTKEGGEYRGRSDCGSGERNRGQVKAPRPSSQIAVIACAATPDAWYLSP